MAFFSTNDLRERYRCSSRTIFRRIKREDNPFPLPAIRQRGAANLWDQAEVIAWEERERERTRQAA